MKTKVMLAALVLSYESKDIGDPSSSQYGLVP
jgi:hypothetical protein